MELDAVYQNVRLRNIEDTFKPRTLNHGQNEGKDGKRRGRRCLVLMTVCLGLICVLLLVSITLQHIFITAERESLFNSNKNSAEQFNQIINSFQDNYTDLTQKKLELETRVKDLTVEKSQLKNNFNTLSQKKLELETRVKDLTVERDQLKNNFNSLSQKKLELETRVNTLTAEKSQLQRRFDSLSQKKLELETRVTSLSDELTRIFFKSNESKNWSESRKYCRDHGGDLIIINTEVKQRLVSSFAKERVWIGLSDIETEGRMKWVDNSTLNEGFWYKGQPNNKGDEDCVELIPTKDPVNNWFDQRCSEMKKGICEKN